MNAPAGAPAPPAAVVGRNIATLGAGELGARLIGFAATVYVARQLGVEAYGVIGFGLAVLLYATTIADGGLEHTGPREVAAAPEDLDRLVSSLLIVRLAWAVVVGLFMLAGAVLFFSGDERAVLGLFALALLPAGLNLRWLHVGLERPGLVAASRIAAELVRVLAIVAFVRGPADLRVVPIAQVIADGIAAALLIAGVRALGLRLRPRVDVELARAVMRRATPMAASGLLAVMIYNADLVFLRAFRDSAEVGLYLAGYTLLNFLGVLGHVVTLTLVPAFTRLRTTPDALHRLFGDAMARVFAGGLPIAVGGALTAPLLILFVFGDEFAESARVLAILIWVLPVVLMRSVLQAGLLAEGAQRLVLRSTVYAAVTNVGLNAIAVPLYGMYGAAVTTLIAEGVRMAAALRYVRRGGVPPTAPARHLRTLAAAAAMGATILLVKPESLWLAVPLGATVYAVALGLTGGIRVGRRGVELRI
jgi:O-antigen/teichoic acid export membrane protein